MLHTLVPFKQRTGPWAPSLRAVFRSVFRSDAVFQATLTHSPTADLVSPYFEPHRQSPVESIGCEANAPDASLASEPDSPGRTSCLRGADALTHRADQTAGHAGRPTWDASPDLSGGLSRRRHRL